MESPDKAHNYLQSQLTSFAESLKIEYAATNRKLVLNEIYIKWQEFKQKIENLNDSLPNLVIQRVQSFQLQKLNATFDELLNDIVTHALQSYKLIAELNFALQPSADIVVPDIESLKELRLLIRNCFLGFTSNLLSITKADFQAKIYLETQSILNFKTGENLQKSQLIYIAVPDNLVKSEKIVEKKLAENEMNNILDSFVGLIRKSYTKKVESIEFHLRTYLEDYFLPWLDDLSNFAGIILAKIAYFNSNLDTLLEPEFNERFNGLIDEFFLNKYPIQLVSLKEVLKKAIENNSIQDAKTSAIQSFLAETNTSKESTTFKMTLDEFFFRTRTKNIKDSVIKTCLKLIKDAVINKKIEIIDADERALIGNYNFAIKHKSMFLIDNDEPWADTSSKKKVEKILLVKDKELVRNRHYVEAVMNFLPTEFEFTKEENNQIFFLIKLVGFYEKKQGNTLLDPSGRNPVVNINLEAFLTFTVRFLAEFTQTQTKMVNKPEPKKLSQNGSPTQVINPSTTRVNANTPANQDMNASLSHYFQVGTQEQPVQSTNPPAQQNDIINIQATSESECITLTDSDSSWETSDDQMFEKLLTQPNCSLFNDVKSLKQALDLRDFTFFDKVSSSSLLKDFITQRNNPNGANQILQPIQVQLSALNNDNVKGLILLFVPSSSAFELLALRIKFSSKNITYFLRDNQNKNLLEIKETLKDFANFIYRHLPPQRFAKEQCTKFENSFFRFQLDPSIDIKAFKYHYFPYYQVLKQDPSTNETESLTPQILKQTFVNYLQASVRSTRGMQTIHDFLDYYSTNVNKLSNIFLFEEQADIETFCRKIEQYLQLSINKNLETNYPKFKSILVFGRVIDEKNFMSDVIIFHLEFGNKASDGGNLDILESPFTGNDTEAGMQNVTIFGDNGSHILQVSQVLDEYLSKQTKGEYQSVNCQTCEIAKAKSEPNFLFAGGEAIQCIMTILLNEGLKITDIVNICRLCPSIRYNYLSSAYQKTYNPSTPLKLKDYGLNFASNKISPPKVVKLAEEIKKSIELLRFEHIRTVKTLMKIENRSSYPKVVTHMIPNGDTSFAVSIQDIKFPQVPYILVILNPKCGVLNTNLCNIIEPDGTVYILKVASEGEKVVVSDSNQDPIAKSIEKVVKSLPKEVGNLKLNFKYHTMYMKNESMVETEMMRALLLGVYLQKYNLIQNPSFSVDENSLFSLLFSKIGVCLQNAPNMLKLVNDIKSQRFLLYESIVIEQAHKYYHDEGLVERLAIMLGSEASKSIVFSIQNEIESSFNLLFKTEAKAITIIVIAIHDWSQGSNATNFYTNLFNLIESRIPNEQFKCISYRYEMEAPQQFLSSADRDLLAVTLADLLRSGQIQKDVNVLQQYLQGWCRPTILSSYILSINQKLQSKLI